MKPYGPDKLCLERLFTAFEKSRREHGREPYYGAVGCIGPQKSTNRKLTPHHSKERQILRALLLSGSKAGARGPVERGLRSKYLESNTRIGCPKFV